MYLDNILFRVNFLCELGLKKRKTCDNNVDAKQTT